MKFVTSQRHLMLPTLFSVLSVLSACSDNADTKRYCAIEVEGYCVESDASFSVHKQSASEYVLYDVLNQDGSIEYSIYAGQFEHQPGLSEVLCDPELDLIEAATELGIESLAGQIENPDLCWGRFVFEREISSARTISISR